MGLGVELLVMVVLVFRAISPSDDIIVLVVVEPCILGPRMSGDGPGFRCKNTSYE